MSISTPWGSRSRSECAVDDALVVARNGASLHGNATLNGVDWISVSSVEEGSMFHVVGGCANLRPPRVPLDVTTRGTYCPGTASNSCNESPFY